MADSLDDFFAKKDKKRGKDKAKSSALSNEALVRELEEGAKQTDYPVRKDKTSVAMELLGIDANDDNWKDFEEVEKRDYTGLKVKEMSLQDSNEEEQRQRATVEQIEQVPESTPWKIKDETVASATAKTQQPAAAADQATKSDTSNTATGSSEDKNSEQNKDTSEKSSTDASTKKDAGAATEVKAKYRPPAQRMMPDSAPGLGSGQVLEPIKLSQTRAFGSRSKEMNLEDKVAFPSLG